MLGEIAYFVAKGSESLVRVTGRVVEAKGETIVVAARPSDAVGIPNQLASTAPGDPTQIAFLRIPKASCVFSKPNIWLGCSPGQLPGAELCMAAWGELGREVLVSSEAEKPPAPVPSKTSARSSGMVEDINQLKMMFQEEEEESEEDSSESDVPRNKKVGRKHLPPGGQSSSSQEPARSRQKSADPQDMLQSFMEKSMAEGKGSSELMPMMMMSMFMDRKSKKSKRHRRSRRIHGGSSSEETSDSDSSEEKGMKAVNSLLRLQKRIRRHPKKIYLAWEKEIVEDLGIVKGQSWTIRDYLRRQSWGKFKGIYRCAMMDAQAYEYLRAGETEAATAQLAQNMKAKLQSVIQQGDWSSAWLLTGLADPLARREFGGSKEEMSVVADYVNQLSKLRKKVKETGGHAEKDED